jgi:hypothetical protein
MLRIDTERQLKSHIFSCLRLLCLSFYLYFPTSLLLLYLSPSFVCFSLVFFLPTIRAEHKIPSLRADNSNVIPPKTESLGTLHFRVVPVFAFHILFHQTKLSETCYGTMFHHISFITRSLNGQFKSKTSITYTVFLLSSCARAGKFSSQICIHCRS